MTEALRKQIENAELGSVLGFGFVKEGGPRKFRGRLQQKYPWVKIILFKKYQEKELRNWCQSLESIGDDPLMKTLEEAGLS